MTLPLGGGHTATAAQMRHFCRSYEFQLPPQPPSMSPPLPSLSTVQFSTLGPGGRHVYCNIPMTLLNGQVGGKRQDHFSFLCSSSIVSSILYFLTCACNQEFHQIKNKTPLFSPGVQSRSLGNKRSVWIKESRINIVTSYYPI